MSSSGPGGEGKVCLERMEGGKNENCSRNIRYKRSKNKKIEKEKSRKKITK